MAREDLGWPALVGMGVATAAILVAGLALGWLVDDLLGTMPVFLMVGLALGLAGAASYIVVKFRTYLND